MWCARLPTSPTKVQSIRQPGSVGVNGVRPVLMRAWRLALPYFRSEDRWAGRVLLASVIAHRTVDRRHQCPDQSVEQRASSTRCRTATGTPSSASSTYFCVLAGGLHRARGLSALSQSMAADPLAALADPGLSRRIGWTTPTITACSCSATPPTIPTSASPRTSSCSSKSMLQIGDRPAQLGRHAVVVHRDPVGIVGGRAVAPVRHR